MVNYQTISHWVNHYKDLGKEDKSQIESLIKEYPWFSLLHTFVAKSNKNESSFLFSGALRKAAAYAGDRNVLYDLMHDQLITDNLSEEIIESILVTPQEEISSPISEIIEYTSPEGLENKIEPVIETKPDDISNKEVIAELQNDEELSSEITKLAPIEEELEAEMVEPEAIEIPEEIVQSEEPVVIHEIVDLVNEEDISLLEEDLEDNLPELDLNKSEEPRFKVVYDPAIALAGLIEHKETIEETPALKIPQITYDPEKALSEIPEPIASDKHDFSFWLDHFGEETKPKKKVVKAPENNDPMDLLNKFLKERPSISRPKAEFYNPENMARKSEELQLDIVSDSLAKLFIKQGLPQKAIEVYEKLMLQNPENNAFFAAQIEILKKEKA